MHLPWCGCINWELERSLVTSAVLARLSRGISQTVRIDCHSYHSRIRISARRSKYFIGENPQKRVQKLSVDRQVAPYDHWYSGDKMATIITGSIFMRNRLCSFIDDFVLDCEI